jgi:hypothetical protein
MSSRFKEAEQTAKQREVESMPKQKRVATTQSEAAAGVQTPKPKGAKSEALRVSTANAKVCFSPAVQIEPDHHHVFISYRRGDCGHRNIDELVLNIKSKLEQRARGLSVFVDQSDIAVGDNWRNKFMTELKQAHVVILIISRNTLRRYERPPPPSLFYRFLKHIGVASESASTSAARVCEDNVLLEWMIALALRKKIFPVFIGDSHPDTGIVGGLLEQGVLGNLLEPPAAAFDATRFCATAFLDSEFEPRVLLPDSCKSLSCIIKDGILALNGESVSGMAWKVVPEFIALKALQWSVLRDMVDQLKTPQKLPYASVTPPSGTRPVPVGRSPRVNGKKICFETTSESPRTQDKTMRDNLFKQCFQRTQLWPHVTQGKTPRRPDSVGFSLFIAEPAELRGTSVDLFPPSQCDSSFVVYITRGDNPDCKDFVQTWKDNRCTLQLPYIDIKCGPHISRHHATLYYNRNQWEPNGIGLADGHFDFQKLSCQLGQPQECPCGFPNPDGKSFSVNGTFVLSFPRDDESGVVMRKSILTAPEAYKLGVEGQSEFIGGFASLDGFADSFMYFMISSAVIGISDPVTAKAVYTNPFQFLWKGSQSSDATKAHPKLANPEATKKRPPPPCDYSPIDERSYFQQSPPMKKQSDPDTRICRLGNMLQRSLHDGSSAEMVGKGNWEKISQNWMK